MLKRSLNSHKQTLSLYYELEAMGFGLKELKLLLNTVIELANANNIPREQAVNKFINDVEEQYDNKLGFESKVNKLEGDVNHLNQQKIKLFGDLSVIPQIANAVAKLFAVGEHGDNSAEEIRLLIDQVHKAGGIRAAVTKLSDKSGIGNKPSVLSLSALHPKTGASGTY